MVRSLGSRRWRQQDDRAGLWRRDLARTAGYESRAGASTDRQIGGGGWWGANCYMDCAKTRGGCMAGYRPTRELLGVEQPSSMGQSGIRRFPWVPAQLTGRGLPCGRDLHLLPCHSSLSLPSAPHRFRQRSRGAAGRMDRCAPAELSAAAGFALDRPSDHLPARPIELVGVGQALPDCLPDARVRFLSKSAWVGAALPPRLGDQLHRVTKAIRPSHTHFAVKGKTWANAPSGCSMALRR